VVAIKRSSMKRVNRPVFERIAVCIAMACLALAAATDADAVCGDRVVDAIQGEGCDDGDHDLNDSCPDGPGGTLSARVLW
jgi:hypothetical protein